MIAWPSGPQRHGVHSDGRKFNKIKNKYDTKNVTQTIAPICRNNYNDIRSLYVISQIVRSNAVVFSTGMMPPVLVRTVGEQRVE